MISSWKRDRDCVFASHKSIVVKLWLNKILQQIHSVIINPHAVYEMRCFLRVSYRFQIIFEIVSDAWDCGPLCFGCRPVSLSVSFAHRRDLDKVSIACMRLSDQDEAKWDASEEGSMGHIVERDQSIARKFKCCYSNWRAWNNNWMLFINLIYPASAQPKIYRE